MQTNEKTTAKKDEGPKVRKRLPQTSGAVTNLKRKFRGVAATLKANAGRKCRARRDKERIKSLAANDPDRVHHEKCDKQSRTCSKCVWAVNTTIWQR